MIDIPTILARALARTEGRAVPIRGTSSLAADPLHAFGIALVRVVSEQRVQAIAFGRLDERPEIVTSWNPLSRESASLEPFATALDAYITTAIASGGTPRIWLPNSSALELIEVMGERYRTNRNATPLLRRMGALCRVLAEEAEYAGQQVVAIACELLTAHVATGQSPVEDRHLGALLTWVNPPPDVDPVEEAARRALSPAAAMLDRQADEEVERFRRIAKRGGADADTARREIERILTDGVLREWSLLTEARRAFWGLLLPSVRGASELLTASRERIAFAAQADLSRPTKAHSLGRLLDAQEYALDVTEDAEVRGDNAAFERAKRTGRAFAATVTAVAQPRRHCHPCTLTLSTDQPILHVRNGKRLQTLDAKVVGRVVSVREGPGASTLIDLLLTTGVRGDRLPRRGMTVQVVDTVLYNAQFHRNEVYAAMRDAASPVVYGDVLPAPRPMGGDAQLVGLAERLRST